MLRALVLIAAVVELASAAAPPFSFMVLGDRTGEPRPDVFARIMSEARLLGPDFIVGTGDLIPGYTSDTTALGAQWDTVLALISATGIPFYLAPGNHDITGPAAEPVFLRRVGRRWQSFTFGNSRFILLDNSRWTVPESMPADEWRWLVAELARARKARHAFVFMHRPYWRYALEQDRPDTLARLFAAAGIDYVFTGHDHFYCRYRQGGTSYFQVGPSGSRTKVYDDPAEGAFQNYLVCEVAGDSVLVTVREPGRTRALPADTVTFESIRALERAKREALELSPVPVPSGLVFSRELPVAVVNLTDSGINTSLAWQDSATPWRIAPDTLDLALAPHSRIDAALRFSLSAADDPYPLPSYALPYRYLPGRSADLSARLPIRREARVMKAERAPLLDGVLNDACWQPAAALAGFGARDGGRSRVEPTEVWLAASDSLLYIAAACRDSHIARAEERQRQRDDKVYEDDHLNIVFDPDRDTTGTDSGPYYQVFVNWAGGLADRKCWGIDGRKDYSWNGDWKVAARRDQAGWYVELSCPLSDFDPPGPVFGLNVVRFQSAAGEISVWQVPFEHDPNTFGVLRRD